MSLPEEITLIRKKGFCTQNEFADRLGVSYSTVNRWETGKMSPNMSAMKRIKAYCDELGIEFDTVELAWLNKSSERKQSEQDE